MIPAPRRHVPGCPIGSLRPLSGLPSVAPHKVPLAPSLPRLPASCTTWQLQPWLCPNRRCFAQLADPTIASCSASPLFPVTSHRASSLDSFSPPVCRFHTRRPANLPAHPPCASVASLVPLAGEGPTWDGWGGWLNHAPGRGGGRGGRSSGTGALELDRVLIPGMCLQAFPTREAVFGTAPGSSEIRRHKDARVPWIKAEWAPRQVQQTGRQH